MGIFIGIGISVIIIIGYLVIKKESDFDVESDFSDIKIAYTKFRKDNQGLTKGIINLKRYLPIESKVNLDNYVMSLDDRFLIVKNIPSGTNGLELANRIGGKSTFKDKKLRLSLYNDSKEIKAEAVITINPITNITTKTLIEYSYKDSVVIEDKIVKFEWVNKKEYFEKPGIYEISLRVMDKNLKWSEWMSKEITVIEEDGINGIESSGDTLILIHNSGIVEGFGNNTSGQFGDGSKVDNKEIGLIKPISKVDNVAVAENHTIFLTSDKKVYTTGKNNYGQLGVGGRKNHEKPELAWGLENIIEISACSDFSVALSSDGCVFTWGHNINGCLAQGKNNFIDRPTKVEGLSNIKAISTGHNTVLALNCDGTVMAWGENKHGQLFLGYKGKSSEPTLTSLKNIDSVICGRGFSYAIDKNGKVLSCGLNKNNQLGYDGPNEVLFSKEIPNLSDVDKLVTCGDHTIALTRTGTIYSWGQFNSIDKDFSLTPFESETLRYIKDISATITYGYALTQNDDVIEFSTKYSKERKLSRMKVKIEEDEE